MNEMNELLREVKKELINGERNNLSFDSIVDRISLVRIYNQSMPMFMILGIIKEHLNDKDSRARVKKLRKDDDFEFTLTQAMWENKDD
jgi:hypothetical protein|tara:strand:+ start:1444 stop:1707 length:264 start_codon:yes stop_codon:yes gene_type:complete